MKSLEALRKRRSAYGVAFGVCLSLGIVLEGCARLPYTTKVLHQDPRVVVTAQQELKPAAFSHPIQLSGTEIAAIFRGFSIREQPRLPLRWFAEEAPPKPLFRADEIAALAPHLTDALQKVGAEERVHFEVIAPGFNPNMRNDVVGGLISVRDPYLYLTVEYFHTQIPTRKSDLYDYNYPTPPPSPKNYLLYFEPGRFWVTDQQGIRALDYRQFLKSATASGTGPTSPAQPGGVP
jgi:hypothetical protein